MEKEILKIEDLSVSYNNGKTTVEAVDGVSLSIERGSVLGVIGESGSGKTTIGMAIMGLLDKTASIKGKIYYTGIDVNQLSEKDKNKYRWNRVAIVYQNHLDILNPVITIYDQISEGLKEHTNLKKKEIKAKIMELSMMVGLHEKWLFYYPHQLSGGMRQKVLIMMALACDPDLLIVDEPTTALDTVAKEEVIDLLYRLQRQSKITMMIISHDMYVIKKLSNRIMVMYKGKVMEEGYTKEVLENPMHIYTRGLLKASIDINPYQDLWGIPGEDIDTKLEGCRFYHRCVQRSDKCKQVLPSLEYISLERKVACNRGGITTLLEGKNINKIYKYKDNSTTACQNCSIKIRYGEVVALIGGSGSGKTTLASILSGILESDSGEVFFKDKAVIGNNCTKIQKGIQMVFQDPFSSTNEHFTILEIVKEPLDILKIGTNDGRKERVMDVLKKVQLPTTDDFLERQCSTLSGGQRQRLALARSLVMKPQLLIADEISSMLDPSTKANMLRLLKGLQNEEGFAMLYITHDMPLARKIADEVYIMNEGSMIEQGRALDVFNNPETNYARILIEKGLV